ncbi:hypothetical protein VTN49DRAFT_2250 [Thermomyces lanuginosus]|uniref:uncharacterized protein n=1 Tax=Thermomyces lanuginosus TaxID=5541 RepID=UPI0037449A91
MSFVELFRFGQGGPLIPLPNPYPFLNNVQADRGTAVSAVDCLLVRYTSTHLQFALKRADCDQQLSAPESFQKGPINPRGHLLACVLSRTLYRC